MPKQTSGRLRHWARQSWTSCQGVWRIVKRHPFSTLLPPLLLLALVLGLGLSVVRELIRSYDESTKARIRSLAYETVTWYKQQLVMIVQPVIQLSNMVTYNPNWSAVQTMFLVLAPTMMNTTSSMDTHLLRLEPAGVVRLEYPANAPDQALGMDVLSPAHAGESALALAAARRHQLTLNGPVNVYDGGYGMIARTPIYIYNVTTDERFGQPDVPNPACGATCAYNATKRTAFWGYAVILFSVNELSTSPDSPLRLLDSLDYRYEFKAVGASDRPLAQSVEPPVHPEEVTVSLYDNEWVLRVSSSDASSAGRYAGLLVGIVVLAVVLACMCFALLVSRKRNKELLEALLPREVIKSLREEQASKSLKDAFGPANILSADTPADLLMLLLGQLLEGNLPDVRDVVFIRTALARGCDLYEPLNLTSHINNANLDSDVAQALMQQLGGGIGGFTQPRYSTNSRVRRRLQSLVAGRSHADSLADYDPDTDTESVAGGGMFASMVVGNGSTASGKPRASEDTGSAPAGEPTGACDTLASALALLMTPRPAAWVKRGAGGAAEMVFGHSNSSTATATPSLMPAGLGAGRVPVSVAAVAAANAAAAAGASSSGTHGRHRPSSLSGTHHFQPQQQERGTPQTLWERAAAALMPSHGGGGSDSGVDREHGRSDKVPARGASAARRASALDPGAGSAQGFPHRLGSSSRRYSVEVSSHVSALGSAAAAAAAASVAAAAGECEDGCSGQQRFSGAGAGVGAGGSTAGPSSPFLSTSQAASQPRSAARLHEALLALNGPAGAGGPGASRPASGSVAVVPLRGRSGRAVAFLPAGSGAAAGAGSGGAAGGGVSGGMPLTGGQVRVTIAPGSGPASAASPLAGGTAGAGGSAGARGGEPVSPTTCKVCTVTRMQPAAVTFAEMRAGVVSGTVEDGGLISGTLARGDEGPTTQTSETDIGTDMGSLLEMGADGAMDLSEIATVVRGAPAELRASSRLARLQLSQQQMLQQLPQLPPPPLQRLPQRPQSLQLGAQSAASRAHQLQDDGLTATELPMPPMARLPLVQPAPPPQQAQRRMSGVLGMLTRRVTGSVGSPVQSPGAVPGASAGASAPEAAAAASAGGSTGPSAGGAGAGGAPGAVAFGPNHNSFSGSLRGIMLNRSASGRAAASSGVVLLSADGTGPLAHQPQSRLGAQEKEKEKEKEKERSGFLSKLGSGRHMTWGSTGVHVGGGAGSSGLVVAANGSSSDAFKVASSQAFAQAQAQALAYARQSMPPAPTVIQEVERLLAKSDSWEFDTWALQEATQGHALSVLGFYLMQRAGLVSRFKLSAPQLARLLRAIESGYVDNPYHSAIHAADVLQTMHVIIHAAQLHVHYLDALGLLASYYAAIVHDFAHPGLTGDFLIATSDPLAIRYNDRSPLENHHCAASFGLLRRRELDALAPLSQSERNAFRKQVIELVLATDMKQHFSILSHFNTVHRLAAYSGQQQAAASSSGPNAVAKRKPPRRTVSRVLSTLPSDDHTAAAAFMDTWTEYPAPRPVDDTERLLSLQLALKCADVGHLGESLEVHKKWLSNLEEEFFRQGDKERELGIPISPLFDRSKQGVSKSQVGFYDFVALPLVHALSSAFPGSKPLMRCFLRNYNHWRVSEGQPPVEIQGCGLAAVRGGSQDQTRGESRNGTGTGMQGLLLSVPDDLDSSAADIVPPLADDNKMSGSDLT